MNFSRRLVRVASAVLILTSAMAVGGGGEAPAQTDPGFAPVARVRTVENNAGKTRSGAGVVSADGLSEVIDNGDGTKTVRVRVAPESVSTGGGRSKVDVALVDDGGRLRAKALSEPVEIGASLASGDVVRVGRPGRQLRFGQPNYSGGTGLRRPAGRARGRSVTRGVRAGESAAELAADSLVERRKSASFNVAEFKDVFGLGNDLTYEVLADAVKESVVLSAAPTGTEAPVFRFPIVADGVTARKGTDGGYEFIDGEGKVAFRIPPAFAYDSRGVKDTPANAYVNVPMELRQDGEGLTLVLSPSLVWLTAKERVYPVVIDPTVQLQPWAPMNLGYMPYGDNSGGAVFSANTNDMQFGNFFGSQWKSYIKFDPTLFAGRTINSATLNMRINYCDAYVNPIHVRQLTSVYFFGQAWPGPSSTGDIVATNTGGSTTASVNITQFATQWAANPSINHGVQLDLGTAQGYCKVQRTAPTGQQTYIEVTYNEAPASAVEYGLLKNFSFETGQSSWQPCYRAEFATWSVATGATPSGSKFSKLRSENTGGGVSLCQTIPYQVGPGKTYNLLATLHSPSGAPVSGRLLLTEVGPAPAVAYQDFTVSGAYWTNFSVQMNGQSASNFGLRAEILVTTPFTTDLDVDYVVLTSNGGPAITTTTTTPTTVAPTTTPPTTAVPPTTAPVSVPVSTGAPTTLPSTPSTAAPTAPPPVPTTAAPPPPPPPVIPSNPWQSSSYKFIANAQTKRCLFPANYVMAAGNAVTGAGCSRDGAEAWFAVQQANGLFVLKPFYDQSLCLDIDNFNPSTLQNELSPPNGARAQLWYCTGTNNQSFNLIQQPSGYWQLQPQTNGNPTNQQKCLDEDVNLTSPASASYVSYVIQHYDCNGQYNQHWEPLAQGIVPPGPGSGGGGAGPSYGAPLQDYRRTSIDTADLTSCINKALTTVVVKGPKNCAYILPILSSGGFLFQNDSDSSQCLGPNLAWVPCTASPPIWVDTDPYGRGSYPDQYYRSPFWFRDGLIPRCITQTGSSISMQPCRSDFVGQIWTDPTFKFRMSSQFQVGYAGAYDYAPMQVGDRLWWCSGQGTDVIVNAKIDGNGVVLDPMAGVSGAARLKRETKVDASTGLVCDPHAVKTSTGYRVFVSFGNADGNGNGVGYYDYDNNGFRTSSATPTVLISRTPGALTYMSGQPSVIQSGTSANGAAQYLMAYRSDGTNPGHVKLQRLDSNMGFFGNARFSVDEVAAQPDIFFKYGLLHLLVSGGNSPQGLTEIGIRTFQPDAAGEVYSLTPNHVSSNGLPRVRSSISTAPFDVICDGAGIVRDNANQPVEDQFGRLRVVMSIRAQSTDCKTLNVANGDVSDIYLNRTIAIP